MDQTHFSHFVGWFSSCVSVGYVHFFGVYAFHGHDGGVHEGFVCVALVVVGGFFCLGYFSAVGVVLLFGYAGGAGYSFFSREEGAFVCEHGFTRSHQPSTSI